MGFAERLLRRRTPLSAITGFAGGNLQDQLVDTDNQNAPISTTPVNESINRQELPMRPTTTMADQYMANAQPVDDLNRPRQANPFQQRLMQGRSRVADPVGFDSEHLRELQSQKDPRWEKILNAAAAGITSATQGGAPIRPIPTRRERDIARVRGQLGQDIAVGREQAQTKAVQSQIDAREAAATQRERANDLRSQGLDQQRQRDHENNLVRTYNAQTDFDPENPSNAQFVAEWQKTFGYKPSKNVRGSQLATVTGYDADGKPMVTIINKGNQTATQATGALPPTTEGQQNRTQRQRIINQQEAGKNARQQQSIAAGNQRQQVGISATNARMGDPQQMYDKASAMWDEAQQKREEAKGLDRRAAAVKIREAEKLENDTRALQRQGDRAKAAQGNAPQRATASSGASFNLGAWKADHPNASEQEIQAQRSKAKARNLSIIE